MAVPLRGCFGFVEQHAVDPVVAKHLVRIELLAEGLELGQAGVDGSDLLGGERVVLAPVGTG